MTSALDIAYRRLHNLRLSADPFAAPEDVVRWLGAVQSQDFGPAVWAVAMRTTLSRSAEVEQAYADGRILRTHVLRPTWHFVLPADIRWLLELTGPRIHATNAYVYRQVGLDEATRRRSDEILVAALQDGQHRTRKELGAALGSAGLAADGLRLGGMVMHAELNGLICSGAPRGKQHTYALLDERAPTAKVLDRDESLAELALRFFSSHGPATVKDLRSRSSLTIADIKRGLAMVGDQLQNEVVDGRTFWFAPSSPPPVPPSPTVHLLQGYDEYVMGYTDSKYLLNLAGRNVPDRPLFIGVVLLDSQLAGHWKRTIKRDEVAFEVSLYAPFDDAQTGALEAAAGRYGDFLGLPASVATTLL